MNIDRQETINEILKIRNEGRIESILSCLAPNELEVFSRRFLNKEKRKYVASTMYNTMTKKIGISIERVRTLERRSLRKIEFIYGNDVFQVYGIGIPIYGNGKQ